MQQAKAVLRSQRMSALKMRLACNAVRGMAVDKALDILGHSNRKSAKSLYKLLASCVANAENNHGMDIDSLFISKIFVDEATVMKRMRARARGRGDRILKRSCHVTVVVSESTEI
ncbi:MAG: 50S ribosomal protein L22 [Pseudomonadota bacterium]|nr:50S ribosomal protein L22 [Pseudomonadota bacterium]